MTKPRRLKVEPKEEFMLKESTPLFHHKTAPNKEPTLKRIFLAPGRAMLDFFGAETIISVLFWLLLVFILT